MEKKEINTQSEQKDWFETNIDDETIRELFKMYMAFYRKIESQFGFIYMNTVKEWSINGINHQNYKVNWEAKPEKRNTESIVRNPETESRSNVKKTKTQDLLDVNLIAETDRYFASEIYNVAARLINEKGKSYKSIALSWLRKIGKEDNFNQIDKWPTNR
jgi:hypothetical protein